MLELIQPYVIYLGASSPEAALAVSRILAAGAVIVLAVVANLVAKRPVLRLLRFLVSRTRTQWDDSLVERRVLHRLCHVAPALVIYVLAPSALGDWLQAIAFTRSVVTLYMLIIGALVLDALLNAVLDIYARFDLSREMHIKGVIQVLKIAVYLVTLILIVSILVGKTPLYILSGLGALTAVLMLIFKDAILGFVAGIQLTANRMVAIGDWIEMPKYGADGDVIEVALTTVKVQNWDKTITTIPTYALITDAFRNWRGMSESGGRRIKRSINIDMNTIRFCDEEMLQRFSRIQYITEYIEGKRREVTDHNRERGIDQTSLVNGRHLTNIGTLRAYIGAYLRNHPMVNQDMTFLIRQLQPTEYGLPLQIYVFCRDQVWANYEAIQADIFDHVLAVVPEFDLRVHQSPAGSDFHRLVA